MSLANYKFAFTVHTFVQTLVLQFYQVLNKWTLITISEF